jgi:hypothetical protein
MRGKWRGDPLSEDWRQVLSGHQGTRSAVNPARQRQAWNVFYGILIAAVIIIGVAELACGQPAIGFLAFGEAGLIAIIGVLVRLNWRILETNRELLETNRELSEKNRELLEERGAERRLRGRE